jgi:hypothetical protein
MGISYKGAIRTHFVPFAASFKRWHDNGCAGDISYGQRRCVTKHRVWIGDEPYLEFSYKELRSIKTEEDLLALWDVAWAITAVTQ